MTNLLDEAVKQISQLPDTEQDEIAKMILDELTWKKSFVSSQKQFEKDLNFNQKTINV